MMKSIYVGLPVKDLAASTKFYEALGFQKNAQFSDDTTSTMVWSDTITFQLQTHERFVGWDSKELADARTTSEVLLTLSLDTREEVDAVVNAAANAGSST